MSDDRPRPAYGEYATPEQQAAAMGRQYVPPEPVTAIPDAVLPQASIARPPGYANRFLTVFLLGLGALTLFGNAPTYFNYATAIRGALSAAGMSSIMVPSSLNAVGVPTLIANVVIYLATVVVSVLVMRRGRVSFYIPLVGWAVFIIVSVILIAAIAPGYVSQLSS